MKENYGGARRKVIEGTSVGYWHVDEYRGAGWYICTCSCGTKRPVHAASLNQGKSRSCGCKTSELAALRMKSQEREVPVTNCEPLYA